MRLMQYDFAAAQLKKQLPAAPHPALRATLPKGEGMEIHYETTFDRP